MENLQTNLQSSGIKQKLKSLLQPKVVYLVLILVIIIELALNLPGLISNKAGPDKITQPQAISKAKLVVLSDREEFLVGDDVDVLVKLATGGQTVQGADLILTFDPSVLEASSSSQIILGKIFASYPQSKIDPAGSVKITGIIGENQLGYNGMGEFASFKLKAKKAGTTSLKVEFDSSTNSSTDSNILKANSTEDVLEKVYDLNISIGNISTQKQPQGQSCEGFTQICADESGRPGTQRCNGGKISANACIWDPELTRDCSSCEITF